MAHTTPALHHHPIVEIVHAQHERLEKVDLRVGQADLGRQALQAVAGGRAYRSYNALSEVVKLNKAGNLRGMVVSAKWQTVFRHVSDAGEYLENIGYLATVASEIAKSAPEFQAIASSSDSIALKGMRLTAEAGTISQRALLGVVPAGAHVIYRSLEGWCMLAGLAGGSFQAEASSCISTLHYADTLVQTSFRAVTDTNNQAAALSKGTWWVIDLFTTKR